MFIYATVYEIAYQLARLFRPFVKSIDAFYDQRISSTRRVNASSFASTDKVLWFHCASLGEFEQIRPLLEQVKSDFPDAKRLVTFFSASGYEIHHNTTLAEEVFYLPFDRKKNISHFLDKIRPNALFLVKYEFWPMLLFYAKKQAIPIFSISSNFRKNQRFFSFWSFGTKRLLQAINHFFVLNERSKELLNSIGIDQVTVSKDTRFDRVLENSKTHKRLPIVEHFLSGKKGFILGSTWPEDHEIFSFETKIDFSLKWIIAPHRVDKKAIDQLTTCLSVPYAKWSTYSKETDFNKSVLILDCIGILSHAYAYGEIAYVGGGMGEKGLHNILEAAVYGIPTLIGKNYINFPEAVDLVQLGGVHSVGNKKMFETTFQSISQDKQKGKSMGNINKNYILSHKGASALIISYVKEWLDL